MKFTSKMQSTKQVFENLIGIWSIKRILGNYGTAEGIAKFTLQNHSQTTTNSSDEKLLVINYREDLKVKYDINLGPNVENSAYKEYVYSYDLARDKIIKKFADGNLFYELSIDFDKQTAMGDHLCQKDLYKATYSFSHPHNFVLTYYVKGPEKDYAIETEFRKQISDS